jgi:hypothetical protein
MRKERGGKLEVKWQGRGEIGDEEERGEKEREMRNGRGN